MLPLLGGKEGVAHICWSMLDPGDVCLAADPGYPVYTSGAMLAGAEPVLMPLRAENRFQPDLEAIDAGDPAARQPALLQLPQQPDRRRHRGRLLRPAGAVRARARDPDRPRQRLLRDHVRRLRAPAASCRRPGAKEAGVEMFSLSKAFNMTGWRVGAAVGNAEMLDRALEAEDEHRLGDVRGDPDGLGTRAERRRRVRPRDVRGLPPPPRPGDRRPGGRRASTCRRRGARSTSGCRCRPGTRPSRSPSWCCEQADVVVSPGSAYGPNGEGYVRLSLTVPDDRLREAVSRIEQHLRPSERPRSRPPILI